MEYPKITIITPSYNQGQYIEQTIQSVLSQNYPNLEYIIIDGGSTDDTIEIIKKYEDKVTYWISEKDQGQSDAINKGFKKSTGEIINWLNSDDFLEPGCLKKIAASFSSPSVTAITSTVKNFIEDGIAWEERTPVMSSSVDYISKGFNNQPGTFFRKSIWDKYFPLPKQFKYTMDQYLWFCYWLESKPENFKIEDYTTVHFRRHAASKTSSSLQDEIFNKLGKEFFNEHNLLFWSYFGQTSKAKAKTLESYFYIGYDFNTRKFFFPTVPTIDKCFIEQIYHGYLIELFKEDYRVGNFNRLSQNITAINRQYLNSRDAEELKRLQGKLKYAPFIKVYRLLYWKAKNLFTR